MRRACHFFRITTFFFISTLSLYFLLLTTMTPPSYTESQKTVNYYDLESPPLTSSIEEPTASVEEILPESTAMLTTASLPNLFLATLLVIPSLVCGLILFWYSSLICGNQSLSLIMAAILGGSASYLLNVTIQNHFWWEMMFEDDDLRAWMKDMAAVVTWYAAGAVYIGIFMGVYECGK